jgi:DNA modification methylase
MIYPDDYVDKIICGDCLEVMKDIPDKSIDMILCDLPYGTTACKWDVIIPFDPLWKHYKRIIKKNGAIVLTASQPFTSALVMSNPKWFKYEWIWEKTNSSGFFMAKKMPMKSHENILIFYSNPPIYNYQKSRDHIPASDAKKRVSSISGDTVYGKIQRNEYIGGDTTRYPRSVLKIKSDKKTGKKLHPTQKPVALFEYLIKTYTNEGELVLDNCIGSGTTAIACTNVNRHFIGIDTDINYCEISRTRLSMI